MPNYSIDPALYPEDASSIADRKAAESIITPPTDNTAPLQSEVDDLLRKKRKAREHKACYPCRQRKVKCDLSRPCQTCVDRDHADICDYNPPSKRAREDMRPGAESVVPVHVEQPASNGSSVVLARSEFDLLCSKLTFLQESITDLKQELGKKKGDQPVVPRYDRRGGLSHLERHGMHSLNEAGEYVHFGAGSIPSMLEALKLPDQNKNRSEIFEHLNKSLLPLFGLDRESATYPFIDLWQLPHGSIQRLQEVANVLPEADQIISLWGSYHASAWVIYPGLSDPVKFREDLDKFLFDRLTWKNGIGGITEQTVYGRSYYWLGLLFAVLAAGVQCASMGRKERELTSQVYLCCAFECARYTNYLSRANMETIQTFTIVQNVLTNNMNAGTAWSMLGTTIRLAQGLGLHQPCPPGTPKVVTYGRAKIWWSIIWQDSLLSIIYDRAGSESLAREGNMPMPEHYGDPGSYQKAMHLLARATLNVVRNRMLERDPEERMAESLHEVEAVMQDVDGHLKDFDLCETKPQRLEYWNLFLHRSFCTAELCRPALSRGSTDTYRILCIENLINSVEAFLGMHTVCGYAQHSWATIHRGLSSALLLGILGEHKGNRRAQRFIAEFINALQDITSGVERQEIAAPMQRGFDALKTLNIPGAATPSDGPTRNTSLSDGALTFDDTSLASMVPGQTPMDEYSPHTILNSILWGKDGPAGNIMAEPMPW